MRRPFIAGNWKMNKTPREAEKLAEGIKNLTAGIEEVEIAVCPPAIDLLVVKEALAGSPVRVGAQNMHWEEEGAYTGELSGTMLTEAGITHVIIGHSERRQYFGETDEGVNKKVRAAFKYGLKPIICVGETLEERENGQTEKKVKGQVEKALEGLSAEQLRETVIAYEPIWAIGTGRTASAADANQVIGFIRELVRGDFGEAAEELRIQYGGSVKPGNIKELMAQPEIDGALVGGASLQADSFTRIVEGAL